MLGRHSEINMLFESTSADALKLIGKRYQGNKLCTWRQIRLKQRSSKWGHLVNRVVNLHFRSSKYQKIRKYPTSKFSIQDYIKAGGVIISIRRNKEAVVNSMVNRTPLTKKLAIKEFERASEILDQVKDHAIEVPFKTLVDKPEEVMVELCEKLDLEFEENMLDGPKFNIIYPTDGFLKEKE